jgi:steroid delta-isomerase-like uncharacterized protein
VKLKLLVLMRSQKEDKVTTQNTMAALVQIGYDAYNDHSFDAHWLERAAAPIAEECEVVDVPSGAILRGPEGFKQFLLGFSTAFPDSRAEVTHLSTTEDGAVVEFVGRGTHTGPLHTPGGDIPPTGRPFELHFCDVYTIKKGKIVRHSTYYDALSLLEQLGAFPQGEHSGE